MNVANHILYRLGGGRFVSAVQAYELSPCERGITFSLPNARVIITMERDGFRVRFTDPCSGAMQCEYSRVTLERLITIFRARAA